MNPGTRQAAAEFNNAAITTYAVNPDRLAYGRWDEQQQKHVGEGDIYASYSADRIATNGKVRKPFNFQRLAWVCTSNCGVAAETQSTAYRLVPLDAFDGHAVTYAEKTADSEVARADPDGFYHGIKVMHRGQPHVLVGPPVHFVPGPRQPQMQLGLFAEA